MAWSPSLTWLILLYFNLVCFSFLLLLRKWVYVVFCPLTFCSHFPLYHLHPGSGLINSAIIFFSVTKFQASTSLTLSDIEYWSICSLTLTSLWLAVLSLPSFLACGGFVCHWDSNSAPLSPWSLVFWREICLSLMELPSSIITHLIFSWILNFFLYLVLLTDGLIHVMQSTFLGYGKLVLYKFSAHEYPRISQDSKVSSCCLIFYALTMYFTLIRNDNYIDVWSFNCWPQILKAVFILPLFIFLLVAWI